MSRVLPILFNTDMVRAILDGRKTVTRRAVKPQPVGIITHNVGYGTDEWGEIKEAATGGKHFSRFKLPYQPGDILYVRETVWQKTGHYLDVDGETKAVFCNEFRYVATDKKPEVGWNYSWAKRPSIHMPKEAARIWLKVTDVRVERLQEITEEQAEKEGILRLYDDLPDAEYEEWTKRTGIYPKPKSEWGYKNYLWHGNFGDCGTGNWKSDNWDYQYSSYNNAIDSFSSLWNSTIKKSDLDRYGWDTNPWVWVIEFERCEKTEPCIIKGVEPAEDKRPCIGYAVSDIDDEPCEMCKGCKQCTGNL